MRLGLNRQDVRTILGFTALIGFLAAGTYGLAIRSVDRLVLKEAELTATGWVDHLSENPREFAALTAGTRPSRADVDAIVNLARIVGIAAVHVYGTDGTLVFSCDKKGIAGLIQPDGSYQTGSIAAVAAKGRTVTRMVRVEDDGGRRDFAESFVALIKDGRTAAIAKVHADVTAEGAALRAHAFDSAIALAVVVGLAFAFPAGAFFYRGRQKRLAEAETQAHYERLQFLIQNMSQGLCLFDADQRLVTCNDQYAHIYHLSPELTRPGTSLTEILRHRIAGGNYSDNDPETYIRERLDVVKAGKKCRTVHEMKDGRVVSISHQPLPSGGWLTTHDDITEIRKIEGRIAHMALHDALTGLPNRVLLRQRIEAALPAAHRGQPFAVHCLDLDHFKSVNDTLGHPVGDELLKQATRRLTRCVRRLDTVARLGGDEFAIIQSGVDSADVATRLAQRICDALKQPFDISGHQVLIDVSIGIALAPQDGTDPDELLKNADLALYRAKGDGRGVYRYFESEMNAMMQERRRLEMALRTGVKEGQFELHYQPIVNVESSAITGFEALLRWNHPERGLVAPGEFLPLAEEIGLIIPLGEWVLREACRQAAAWPGNYRVAVNLSAHQFRSMNLVPTVIGALSTAGLPARRLELEITESALLNDSASTLRTLHMLRGLGVRIAMDDFGTGYSSLSYLRQFPFDKVKIDGSFVKELAEASESLAIVRAITGLGASLGMETTAEGVETEAQLDRIRAEGCSEIQGYFFSPPCPEGELAARFFGDEGQLKSAVGE